MTDVTYYAEAPRASSNHESRKAEGSAAPVGPVGLVTWVGAGCSLALVAGLTFWGVQLTLQDSREVPVIAALEGPMRVAPEEPGGMQAAYQGLAVNRIKAGGAAEPAPDQVILAPPPVALEPLTNVTQTSAAAGAEAARDEEPDAYRSLDVSELATELSEEDVSLAAPAVEAVEEAALAIVPRSVPGIARSGRPEPRPAALRTTRPAPGAQPAAQPAATRAEVPPGTRLVQLGAFDTAKQAETAWAQLNRRFGDYLEGKQRLVQNTVSGGREFYRLRVMGFEDARAAQRFCSAFLARDAACIPVTAK